MGGGDQELHHNQLAPENSTLRIRKEKSEQKKKKNIK